MRQGPSIVIIKGWLQISEYNFEYIDFALIPKFWLEELFNKYLYDKE